MEEIIFEVREVEIDGGCVAIAVRPAIAPQGEIVEELRAEINRYPPSRKE